MELSCPPIVFSSSATQTVAINYGQIQTRVLTVVSLQEINNKPGLPERAISRKSCDFGSPGAGTFEVRLAPLSGAVLGSKTKISQFLNFQLKSGNFRASLGEKW